MSIQVKKLRTLHSLIGFELK